MLFITKRLINKLTAPYQESDMYRCYATSQSIASITNRAILLVNSNKMIILFLNFFSTSVVHKIEYSISDLENQKYRSASPLSVVWSFDARGQHWRFNIVKVILPLGSMQGEFLQFVNQNVIK